MIAETTVPSQSTTTTLKEFNGEQVGDHGIFESKAACLSGYRRKLATKDVADTGDINIKMETVSPGSPSGNQGAMNSSNKKRKTSDTFSPNGNVPPFVRTFSGSSDRSGSKYKMTPFPQCVNTNSNMSPRLQGNNGNGRINMSVESVPFLPLSPAMTTGTYWAKVKVVNGQVVECIRIPDNQSPLMSSRYMSPRGGFTASPNHSLGNRPSFLNLLTVDNARHMSNGGSMSPGGMTSPMSRSINVKQIADNEAAVATAALALTSVANSPVRGLRKKKLTQKKKAKLRTSKRTLQPRWTKEEDAILSLAIAEYGATAASESGESVNVVNTEDGSTSNSLQNLKNLGSTSIESRASLLGTRWSIIAKKLPGRLGKQCRERWFNHLDPTLKTKKMKWTDAEDQILFDMQKIVGNKWCEISKSLEGRSENSIKNRWNSKKLRIKRNLIPKKTPRNKYSMVAMNEVRGSGVF